MPGEDIVEPIRVSGPGLVPPSSVLRRSMHINHDGS